MKMDNSSFYARPEVSVDYFRLHQDGYTESALRNADLALEVGASDTSRTSTTALLALGADWKISGDVFRIFPEARIGARHEISGTAYETTARFINGAESFQIQSQDEFSDAFVAGVSFNSSSSIFSARLSYDLEASGTGTVHYVGASGILRF